MEIDTRLNWTPLIYLGAVGSLWLLTRFLTILFWWRRLRKIQDLSGLDAETEMQKIATECWSPKTHPIPILVSYSYALAFVLFAAVTLWGTFNTAWWVLFLALLIAILVHLPFRESMASLNHLEKIGRVLPKHLQGK